MRTGRIAGYIRLPEHPTELVLDEHALLQLARHHEWGYVRFFRDRHDTQDGWQSLLQAVTRGEILGLLMMSIRLIPVEQRRTFFELILRRGVRLLTVAEELDSWQPEHRLWLAGQISDEF